MKYIKPIYASLILLLFAPLVAASESEVLTELIVDFLQGATVNDASVHDNFWAEELVYTSSNGTRFGKKQLMEGVRQAGPQPATADTTIYSAENIQVWQHQDTAVVTFTLVGKSGQGDTSETKKYLNSGTFVKRDNRWQAVNWQATIKAAD
ncbi:nuclear transport factor 2 family protein [Neptunicella sp. SCSIO 80796]|uniref:nuclear transport factor 2 family protein n=1 Tax=Neptunicella plasticusilytica TaxID=3117012 RepID=UPI003A4E5FF3